MDNPLIPTFFVLLTILLLLLVNEKLLQRIQFLSKSNFGIYFEKILIVAMYIVICILLLQAWNLQRTPDVDDFRATWGDR